MMNPGNELNPSITFDDFLKVELRAGTIIDAQYFEKARKPAYQITANFGAFGIKKSSAQITVNYKPEDLIGKQIIAVINFEPKQIANFVSEFLITGFPDENGNIVLAQPQFKVPDGVKLI